jgi:hypothetical protein
MPLDDEARAQRIDRLLDAIDLISEGKRAEARAILRELIREDNDFEDAWLWMSVTADSVDQSTVCLDNVLRINPKNMQALGAMYRLRERDMKSEHTRARLRGYRDFSVFWLWLLTIGILFAVLFTGFGMMRGGL